MALTARQQRFVEEYLVDLNASQAAIRAGSHAERAKQAGYQMMKIPGVRAAIAERQDQRAEATGIKAERVLEEIRHLAFFDPGTVAGSVGGPADIARLPENVRRAIIGWGWDRAGNFTLKFADKSRALEQLARHLSLFNDKLEVTGFDKLAERVARAKQRGGR